MYAFIWLKKNPVPSAASSARGRCCTQDQMPLISQVTAFIASNLFIGPVQSSFEQGLSIL